jgi:LysR family transcriptional regulator, transcription activator of glutamate synthase operon
MDTRDLRWFQLVADGVTVTEVGELEHIAQSAVSRALARLEVEVGAPLLHRTGRTLRMTHAGAAFKHHVDALMHELDDGLAAVHQLVDPESGTVTLSFQPSLGSWLVPDLIAGFRADHPGVGFVLRPTSDELVSDVQLRGEVDLELSTLRPRAAHLRWRRITDEPLLLAVPPDHDLASRGDVALADVADASFVTIRRTSMLRRLGDDLCRSAGFEPRVAFECDDLPSMRGFVAAGLGVAIVPAPRGAGADGATGRVTHLRITDAGARREVGMVWSTERRTLPAAELFRAHVVERATAGRLPVVDGPV